MKILYVCEKYLIFWDNLKQTYSKADAISLNVRRNKYVSERFSIYKLKNILTYFNLLANTSQAYVKKTTNKISLSKFPAFPISNINSHVTVLLKTQRDINCVEIKANLHDKKLNKQSFKLLIGY